MELVLYIDIAISVVALISFIFGLRKYVGRRKPLYATMIVFGVGCILLGRSYTVFRILAGMPVVGIFHAGILGRVGVFAFFFSSNFGQVDSLVDDGSRSFIKYRIIAVSGILITAAIYALILLSPAGLAEKISDGLAAAMIAPASYFHVKHIIIPDVDYGVVRCLRGFNTVALLFGIFSMAELAVAAYGSVPEPLGLNAVLYCICGAVLCVLSGILIPVMDRGVRKWSK
ncbi:MAG: hypothetical protein IJT87_09310 [Ruminiclostridium sp.]|nr:hypothetical protein [Ruminiclostridium sp.]